ncbi:MAG: RAMP superfamily CRISPR-associated protein [Acidobacteria bacterium]|jgi:CRISPR/Cas system CSM-associated protein Csm3 (group 7 of RAMP superfamily)|nr:RAMP superfamily CRISPR-associated protein [Acidobacteriota bacterium]
MNNFKQPRLQGKVYFSGELIFTDSFVSISSGFGNENTDSLVYRDSSGRLIIPATSFAGVLRRQLDIQYADKKELAELFGVPEDCNENNNISHGHASTTRTNTDKNEKCSDIVFTDLYPTGEGKSMVQQGVRIDRDYLAAENQGKYDREIVLNERFTFFFYIEKTRKNHESIAKWQDRLAALLHKDNIFFLGGRNSVGNGWGHFESVYIMDYDFTQPGKLMDFLSRKTGEKEYIQALMKQGPHLLPHLLPNDVQAAPAKTRMQLDYTITFQDAVLVDDPDGEPDEDEADFNFLTIDGRYTIPGSSIKGVFRHRSEMIAGTINMNPGTIKEVFGYAGTENKEKKEDEPAQKSAIYFSYAFQDGQPPKKQLLNGVSIDRFTGGAAEAALFDFKLLMNPVFKGRIIMELKEETLPYLPILYLVIRDIKDQDLSFGFGRTKGWGRAQSFAYQLSFSNLPLPVGMGDMGNMGNMGLYFQGNDFNLETLANLHQKNINQEAA